MGQMEEYAELYDAFGALLESLLKASKNNEPTMAYVINPIIKKINTLYDMGIQSYINNDLASALFHWYDVCMQYKTLQKKLKRSDITTLNDADHYGVQPFYSESAAELMLIEDWYILLLKKIQIEYNISKELTNLLGERYLRCSATNSNKGIYKNAIKFCIENDIDTLGVDGIIATIFDGRFGEIWLGKQDGSYTLVYIT